MLGRGSKWKDNEIRYSLRSVEKFVQHDNVIVVGECPRFLKNVFHIPCEDKPRRSFSIFSKIMKAIDNPGVSEDFIFFNDDHFVLEPVNRWEYWVDGTVKDYSLKAAGSFKTRARNVLALDPDAFFADVHTPIVFNKQKFRERVGGLDWSKEYLIKSSYCIAETLLAEMQDCKIYKASLNEEEIKEIIKDKPFFSIGPWAINQGIRNVLEWLYPEPSKYEV